MTATPVFPQTLANTAVAITNATGSGAANTVTIRTGSTNGDKIESISVTSTDTSNRVLTIVMTISATDYVIGTLSVPANSGTDAATTPAVSMLEKTAMMPWIRVDQNGRPYIYLGNGIILKAYAQTTVTAAKEIDIVTQVGAF